MKKVRWGVLGVARIGVNRVIPAMQNGQHTEIVAIASRDLGRAQAAARELGIAKAYGSYAIKTSRMVFGEEPVQVSASIARDPRFGNIDMLTSAILEYPSGHCVFTCSTQIMLQQSMRFYGTEGRLEPEIPFNAAINRVARISIDDGRDLEGGGKAVEEIATCDQYTIQGDLFSRAIRED